MQDKYRKHMTWWLDEFCAGDTGDFITVDELKSILGTKNYNKLLCKYAEDH